MIALRAQRVCALAGAGDGKHLAPNAQSRPTAQPHRSALFLLSLFGPVGGQRWRFSLNPPGQIQTKKKKGASQPDRAPFNLAQKREPAATVDVAMVALVAVLRLS